jgi:murein DD-endopeptidase MepM/ murein hydrolase activator NlpD
MASAAPSRLVRAAAAALLCALLAACNQSGRPRNAVAPKPAPAIAVPAVPAADFGKVIGGAYIVAPGDTLAAVSRRTDTPIRSLIDMNNLQPPYALAAGMRLSLQQRSQYVVQQGDTLSGLAKRYGTSEGTLAAINNLQPPYVVRPGQRISIPGENESANLPATSAAAVPPPTPVGSVTSAPLSIPATAPTSTTPASTTTTPASTTPASTLPSTTATTTPAASGSGISAQSLPAPAGTATPLPAPAPTATTTTLPKPTTQTTMSPLPPAPKPVEAQASALPAPAAVPTTPVTPPPATTTTTATTTTKPIVTAPKPAAPATVAPDTETQAAMQAGPAAGSGKGPFVWPVQGKVISTFGSSKDGTKNDGINIAAPAGAPVVAAADGTVAYAGNELRGFGNMILLRHDGGYVTAYAHNASLLVKKGDKVKRGQTIARVGATGAVFGPQLHFEIRKGTEPLDPMSFLGS